MTNGYDFSDVGPDAALLSGYWEAQRGDLAMPRRADIDVLDLPAKLWPRLILLGVSYDPLRLYYRIVGTAVAEMVGADWTGRYLDEVTVAPPSVVAQNMETIELGRPTTHIFNYCRVDPEIDEIRELRFERVIFPMSDDGERVTHLFGAVFPRIAKERVD